MAAKADKVKKGKKLPNTALPEQDHISSLGHAGPSGSSCSQLGSGSASGSGSGGASRKGLSESAHDDNHYQHSNFDGSENEAFLSDVPAPDVAASSPTKTTAEPRNNAFEVDDLFALLTQLHATTSKLQHFDKLYAQKKALVNDLRRAPKPIPQSPLFDEENELHMRLKDIETKASFLRAEVEELRRNVAARAPREVEMEGEKTLDLAKWEEMGECLKNIESKLLGADPTKVVGTALDELKK
ncbi:hypothetical protein HDV00_009704 [Rhizophlyctis rosea]|nr:hypothetical protein HDV00_009704 [Rhizophlyctis rosea]